MRFHFTPPDGCSILRGCVPRGKWRQGVGPGRMIVALHQTCKKARTITQQCEPAQQPRSRCRARRNTGVATRSQQGATCCLTSFTINITMWDGGNGGSGAKDRARTGEPQDGIFILGLFWAVIWFCPAPIIASLNCPFCLSTKCHTGWPHATPSGCSNRVSGFSGV